MFGVLYLYLVFQRKSDMTLRSFLSYLILLFLAISLNSCLEVQESYSGPAPGTWRGILKLETDYVSKNKKGEPLPEKMEVQFKDINEKELPFLFDVLYDENNKLKIEIINASERIIVNDIQLGVDRKTARDTIEIDFPVYGSSLKAVYRGGIMEGEWIVHNKKNYRIPFVAKQGKTNRFTIQQNKPKMDVSGKWKVTFDADKDDPYMAIGEFEQKGNKLEGTFLTETGDFRFLEGTIQGDKVFLSCFDGSHAFLFTADVEDDLSLRGFFRSGKHYKSYWEARRDDAFTLASPDSLTYLKKGYDKIEFSFKNPKGELISLNDEAYKNKIKIVQILGTWCPNCRDETKFLVDYQNKFPNESLAYISLAFEKHKEASKYMKAIQTYKEKLNIKHEIVYAGSSNKEEALLSLPMLNQIISYPTMIFIDKNDKVRRIHTGFAGPATSEYENFTKDFKSYVQNLLNE